MSKIRMEEVDNLFPKGVPLVVMKIMFPERSQPLTKDEVREVIRAFSKTLSSQPQKGE